MLEVIGGVVLMIVPTRKALTGGKSSEDPLMLKLDGGPQKGKEKSGVKRES